MKIKPILARLQSAIGRDDLIEEILFLPSPDKSLRSDKGTQAVNIMVGYDGSRNSHTALDIACWVAYQTGLATKNQVTVHAVYVVEEKNVDTDKGIISDYATTLNYAGSKVSNSRSLLLIKSQKYINAADRILVQAENLASEWRVSLKVHMRFGNIYQELKKVTELTSTDILFLGCKSIGDPIITTITMGGSFPCAVSGIPHGIDE